MAEDGFSNRSQRPLAGVVLCCTSILPEKRSELAAIATQMGAEHNLDLTSDVTHLLVGDINTPKYKYVAKEREDVKVLSPDWVEAVRESWMQGGDTDVEALEQEYQLPTFAGLSICLTGFDDLAFRTELQNGITKNGGHYTGDLTKSVTHLIARIPEGKKYTYARQWNIKVVGLKWFKASLERGMALEETLYHPSTPESEQGIGAWNRLSPKPHLLGKRSRDEEPIINPVRKLRRTASARLGSQNEGIWTDIVGGGFAVKPQQHKQWDDIDQAMRPPLRPGPMVMEPRSFASDTPIPERRDSAVTKRDQPTAQEMIPTSKGFFHGRTFFIYGFTGRQISMLEKYLYENDGSVVLSLNELPRTYSRDWSFMLVPYNFAKEDLPTADEDNCSTPTIVTDMWLHRCLHSKQFVTPDAHPTSILFPAFPIPEFEGLKICSTGFSENSAIELLQISQIVELMGATYDEDLNSKTSILICNSKNAREEKIRLAYAYDIPTVSAEWLWNSSRETRKLTFEKYRVATPQYIIDETKTSREEREKSRNRRTNHDRIEQARNLPKKDIGSSKGKRHANAEAAMPDTANHPYLAKENAKQAEHHTPVPTVPLDANTVNRDSESTSTSKSTSPSTSSDALIPTPTLPLREISTNSPPKPNSATFSPSPPKDSLNPQSQLQQPPNLPPAIPPPNNETKINANANTITSEANSHRKRSAIGSLISSLRSRSKTKPSSADSNPSTNDGRSRRTLLGRANSSSSSAKHAPPLPTTTSALSRTNSIGSVNSDGLGSIIPTQSQNPNHASENTDASISAAAQILQWQSHAHLPPHLRPDIPETSGGEEVVLTQLGYENAGSAGDKEKGGKTESRVRDIEGFTSIGGPGKGRRGKLRRDV